MAGGGFPCEYERGCDVVVGIRVDTLNASAAEAPLPEFAFGFVLPEPTNEPPRLLESHMPSQQTTAQLSTADGLPALTYDLTTPFAHKVQVAIAHMPFGQKVDDLTYALTVVLTNGEALEKAGVDSLVVVTTIERLDPAGSWSCNGAFDDAAALEECMSVCAIGRDAERAEVPGWYEILNRDTELSPVQQGQLLAGLGVQSLDEAFDQAKGSILQYHKQNVPTAQEELIYFYSHRGADGGMGDGFAFYASDSQGENLLARAVNGRFTECALRISPDEYDAHYKWQRQ